MGVDADSTYQYLKRQYRKSTNVSDTVRTAGSRILRLIHKELKTAPDIPVSLKLWAYRNGYISASVPLYALSEENRHKYLSAWQRERARTINGEFDLVHENKLLFNFVLQPSFPDLYGYIDRGEFVSLPFSPSRYDSLVGCVDDAEKAIIKPAGGSLGNGIYVLEQADEEYRINGTPTQPAEISHLADELDGYIVSEFVEQAAYADRIFAGAPNTIRVMTMVDPERREPFIGGLGHRFGTSRSTPVDNAAQGGLSAGIDAQTGQLEEAIELPQDETVDHYSSHPETGSAIEGVQIPGWQRIQTQILEMAAYLAPMTPYVGWDILVTDSDGSVAVLEANSYPDVPLQVHKPLLTDERVRRFYDSHDVL